MPGSAARFGGRRSACAVECCYSRTARENFVCLRAPSPPRAPRRRAPGRQKRRGPPAGAVVGRGGAGRYGEVRAVDAGGLLRDGLHDALLGRLLVLIDELVNSFQVGDADLALLRVGLGFRRLAGGEQRQRKQYPSEHCAGWRVTYFDASLGEARLHKRCHSVSQRQEGICACRVATTTLLHGAIRCNLAYLQKAPRGA